MSRAGVALRYADGLEIGRFKPVLSVSLKYH